MRASDRFVQISGIAGVIGILALTAGCGGGGGGSSSGGASASTAFPKLPTLPPGSHSVLPSDNAVHNFAPGSEWVYAVNGDRIINGQIETISKGAYMRSVDNETDANVPGLLGLTEQWNLVFNNNATDIENLTTAVQHNGASYIEWGDTEDTSGNFESTGNNPCEDFDSGNASNENAQPLPLFPATFTAGTGVSGSAALNVPTGVITPPTTGDPPSYCEYGATITNQESTSFTLQSITSITVPAGTFQCWKVTSSHTYVAEGITENQTAWWAPQFGSFVEMNEQLSNTSAGYTASYVYQLVGFEPAAFS